ncbi:MAG: adenylate/guanylate cyclase domain-containing protein, partial [Hyphomicrobiaceae bacterium]
MSTKRMRRRLAAVLALDVAGYSRMMAADEAGTLSALLELRKKVVEPELIDHNGRMVKVMGDGALIEFASAVDAVECALEIQERVAANDADLPDDKAIRLRIGVNLGDIIVQQGDIYGDGVNVAARLEAVAEPGGICISGTVFDQVNGKLEIGFEDLGLQEVKNIAQPVRVYSVGADAVQSPSAPIAPAQDKPSIAILPLDDLSGEKEQKYFCDAVSEDLTTALSRFDWLHVAARNAAFAYRGDAIDIRRVGNELGVRYVIEGSVRRIDNRIRVNVQLVDSETLGHAWADLMDYDVADLFELQDDVVARIASTVAPEVVQAEIARTNRKPPEALGPWDHYLR